MCRQPLFSLSGFSARYRSGIQGLLLSSHRQFQFHGSRTAKSSHFPCCSETFLSPRPPKGLLMHKEKMEILHRFHSCRYAGFSFPFPGIAFFFFMKLPVFSDIFLSLLSCIVSLSFLLKVKFFLFISVFLIL